MKILLLILIMIINIMILVNTSKKLNIVGGFSGIYFSLIFNYLLIPVLLLFTENQFREGLSDNYGYDRLVTYFFNVPNENFYFSIFIILIGFTFFNLGYKYNIKLSDGNKNSSIKNNIINFTKTNQYNINFIIRVFAIISIVVGFISLLIFTFSVGGVNRALSLAETTRGFEISIAEMNYISGITKLVSRIITVAAIFYLYLSMDTQKTLYKIMSYISFVLSLYYFLINAGRMPLLTFLVIYLYIFLRKRFGKGWITVVFIGFLSLPLIDVLSNIFLYFQTGNWNKVDVNLLNYLRQLAPAIYELLNVRDIVNIYGYQFFKYIPTDILSMIPGLNFGHSYVIPSEYFNGLGWRFIGGIPNDILSYGYIQLGVFGVIITMFVVGKIMYYIDSTIINIENQNLRLVLSTAVATQVFQIVSAADLGPIIRSNFIFIFIIVIIYLYNLVTRNHVILKVK